jgi:hypothetical protein
MRSAHLLHQPFKLMIHPVNALTNTLGTNLTVPASLIVAKNHSSFSHFKRLFTK